MSRFVDPHLALPADPRSGALRGLGPLVVVLAAQLGHLAEHILLRIHGSAVFGPAANSEVTHLGFNALIAIASLVFLRLYRANPWVYPLALISVFHGLEHIYIFEQSVRTGVVGGPGLFGVGGAIGLFPIVRVDLHNIYNGLELVLMVLGIQYQLALAPDDQE